VLHCIVSWCLFKCTLCVCMIRASTYIRARVSRYIYIYTYIRVRVFSEMHVMADKEGKTLDFYVRGASAPLPLHTQLDFSEVVQLQAQQKQLPGTCVCVCVCVCVILCVYLCPPTHYTSHTTHHTLHITHYTSHTTHHTAPKDAATVEAWRAAVAQAGV
jgi:hypothetical protein